MTEIPTTADQWLETIHREFNRESDRAAAIVVAAMLDEALTLLLQKRLLAPRSRTADILNGERAPLHSFSAKIDAAHQLGLISGYMARDLHLMRKIRNEFAHQSLELNFGPRSLRSLGPPQVNGSVRQQEMPHGNHTIAVCGPACRQRIVFHATLW